MTFLTKRRVVFLMALPWAIGFLLYCPGVVLWKVFHADYVAIAGHCIPPFLYNLTFNFIGSSIDFVLPYILVIAFHIKLYTNIRKRTMQVVPFQVGPSDGRLKKDRKTAISLSVLTGIYGATWMPYVIAVITDTFCSGCVSIMALEATGSLMIINSAVNPFIYPIMQNKFRKVFLYLLRSPFTRCTNSNSVNVAE